jgi:hypothetical protein
MLDNIKNFIGAHKFKLLLGIVVLTYFKTCGVGDRVKDEHRDLEVKITELQNKVDSLIKVSPTKKQIDKSFEKTMWEFLEKEELADKKGFTVSQMKHMKD